MAAQSPSTDARTDCCRRSIQPSTYQAFDTSSLRRIRLSTYQAVKPSTYRVVSVSDRQCLQPPMSPAINATQQAGDVAGRHRVKPSAHPVLCASCLPRLQSSTPQSSTLPVINASGHPRLQSSTPPVIDASSRQHIQSSAPQAFQASCFPRVKP